MDKRGKQKRIWPNLSLIEVKSEIENELLLGAQIDL